MRRKCCREVPAFEPWPMDVNTGMPPWWIHKDSALHCLASMPQCECGDQYHHNYSCIQDKDHQGLHVGMSKTHRTVSWDGEAPRSKPEYA